MGQKGNLVEPPRSANMPVPEREKNLGFFGTPKWWPLDTSPIMEGPNIANVGGSLFGLFHLFLFLRGAIPKSATAQSNEPAHSARTGAVSLFTMHWGFTKGGLDKAIVIKSVQTKSMSSRFMTRVI